MITAGTPLFYEQRIFPAHYKSLQSIGEFVQLAGRVAGFDDTACYSIQLAVDEACSNIIEHAYRENEELGDIECTCSVTDEALIVELHDFGIPFNPAAVPQPNINATLENRRKGGLGLYFIHHLMDEVKFHFEPAKENKSPKTSGNYLTLVKWKGVTK